MKRKWDKASLEEVAQIAAFACAVTEEAKLGMPTSAHDKIEDAGKGGLLRNEANTVMELQAIVHELRPDFKWQQLTYLEEIEKKAVADADVAVTGMAMTQQMATKLERDEFELDKSKIEFDIQTLSEYRAKVKSRETRIYFGKLEKVNQRCNKAVNIVRELLCPGQGQVQVSAARGQKNAWDSLCVFMKEVQRQNGLSSTDAITKLVLNNWAVPSMISSEHQKTQAALVGAVVNNSTHCAGLTIQPVWSTTKGQVVDVTGKLLKSIENNNVSLDNNFSIIVDNKIDERDERPMNYPGRICLGLANKRAENVWWKTSLFAKGVVATNELMRSRHMVRLEDQGEDTLPADSNPVTHIKQCEKHHQLGPKVWQSVLEATVGTLPPREDAGRSAIMIIDTHARTGEIAKAVCQMLSSMTVPVYYWGLTSETPVKTGFRSKHKLDKALVTATCDHSSGRKIHRK